MQTRRDQAQAHAFVMGRLVSALLRADPDAPMTPLRRFLVGAVGGLLLACIVLVGFGVYGFFVPGENTAWRKPGVLVVEKETGASYVVVDGVLRPVLNYASARLILEGSPKIVTASRNSLRDAPRGLPVGIVGAPDYLPDPTALTATAWQVCSATRQNATGADEAHVSLTIGPKVDLTTIAGGEGLLVKTPGEQIYLVTAGRRLRVPNATTLGALGYAAATARLVGWSWINAVPAGQDLVSEEIPFRGTAGPTIDGRASVVGQLFRVPAVGSGVREQFFVMRRDGLSALTPLGAALMLADPMTQNAYPGTKAALLELSAAAMAGLAKSVLSSVNEELPAEPPVLRRFDGKEIPCLGITMAPGGPAVTVGVAVAPTMANSSSTGRADQISVQPGTGLLIRAQPAPGVSDGALFLLVDNGLRYPIPTDETVSVLGYEVSAAYVVPAPILALLPAGRPLDPVAARGTVEAVPTSTTPSK